MLKCGFVQSSVLLPNFIKPLMLFAGLVLIARIVIFIPFFSAGPNLHFPVELKIYKEIFDK